MVEPEEPFARVVETLKEPVAINPSLTSRVMAEVERLPAPAMSRDPGRSLVAWWRRRWTIRLSPAGALAAAAGLAAVVAIGSRLAAPAAESYPSGSAGAVEPARPTQFVLVAPRAASVTVVGDFNDWSLSATPLARAEGDGVWWVTVSLAPGRYRYSFVVDGTVWREDPEAPAVAEEFGRPTSVVTVGGP